MAQREKINIHMYQGDSRGYKFTFYTDTAQTTPWDFSAATQVTFYAKKTFDADSVIFSVSATNGAGGNNWASGIAIFRVDGDQSALLARDGKYDVQVLIGGEVIAPVSGDIILERRVGTLTAP